MAKNDRIAGDARIKRDNDPAGDRGTPHANDSARGADTELMSAEQRRAMLRNEWLYEALPQPPIIEGFHLCWLSTTNTYDPIYKRARMGYVPVKLEEVPGYEHLKVHSGEWVGCVAVNEMLLFKIPTERYQEIMTELHHNMPLEEEGRIRDSLAQMQEAQRDSAGKKLGHLEEGFSSLGESQVPKPTFQP